MYHKIQGTCVWDFMSLEVTELEEGECAAFHWAVVFFGDEAVKLLLMTLQKLGSAKLPPAIVYIALVGSGLLMAHQMASQSTLRLERLCTLVTFEGADLSVDLHVSSHVVLRREHLVTQQAFDVLGALDMHVLHMLVQVGSVVGRVVTLGAVEQLGLVWEVCVMVYLRHTPARSMQATVLSKSSRCVQRNSLGWGVLC